jgi:hypothetical protein
MIASLSSSSAAWALRLVLVARAAAAGAALSSLMGVPAAAPPRGRAAPGGETRDRTEPDPYDGLTESPEW